MSFEQNDYSAGKSSLPALRSRGGQKGSRQSRSSRAPSRAAVMVAERQHRGREIAKLPTKAVSHLGPPEGEGKGLRDITGYGSRVDPKVGPVWEHKTEINKSELSTSQENTAG